MRFALGLKGLCEGSRQVTCLHFCSDDPSFPFLAEQHKDTADSLSGATKDQGIADQCTWRQGCPSVSVYQSIPHVSR